MSLKEELTLGHLAPYLPYGLKVKLEFKPDTEIPWYYEDKEVFTMEGMMLDWYGSEITEVKPYLRPLSDLTREIEHNGERFVPINRLMDISWGTKWSATEYLESPAFNRQDDGIIVVWTNFKDKLKKATFGYSSAGYFFALNSHGEAVPVVYRQLELFKKLYEWHFDVFGLIDKGLALAIK